MKYTDYSRMKQEEFNALPIFWAFSTDQLEEKLLERGYTLGDAGRVLYRFGNGGFYLKKDSAIVKAYFEKDWVAELRERMEADHEFAREAFEYEMWNHEYPINWQGDWDVCSCFGNVEYDDGKYGDDYLRELGYSEELIRIYEQAARTVRSADCW